jgi:hypothetical protein
VKSTVAKLTRSLQLFDSLFNGRVEFTDQQWIDMFHNESHELTQEGKAVQSLTRLPNLMRRSKAFLTGNSYPQDSLSELRKQFHGLRDELEPSLVSVRERWHATKSQPTTGMHPLVPYPADMIHCHFLRTYSFGLMIVIFINEARLALCPNREDIIRESHDFALEILELASIATRYRPFGAFVIAVCLVAAELGAGDNLVTRDAVKKMRLEYARDFKGIERCIRSERPRLICGREWAQLLPPELY